MIDCLKCIHFSVCSRNMGGMNLVKCQDYLKTIDIEQYYNHNGWFSIDDEIKPRIMEECLCICRFDDTDSNKYDYYMVLKWHDGPMQDNGYVNRPHFTNEGVAGMKVVYWRPLPTHPEKEQTND